MKSDLRKAAKAALEQAGDNPRRATMCIVRVAKNNLEIRDQLITLGANQIIRDYFCRQRQSAMSMAVARIEANMNNPQVAKRMAARMARVEFWKTYTLYGMEPIETAARDTLIASAQAREAQANTELRLAKFERAVASRLTGTKTVRQCMTLDELVKLAGKYGAIDA